MRWTCGTDPCRRAHVPPPHRRVGNAVLDEPPAARLEAEAGVPVHEVRLGVEDHGALPRQRQGSVHQGRRQAGPAVGSAGGNAPDPQVRALVEEPQRGHGLAAVLDPQVPGGGLDVPAVEVEVRAVLLHDEDFGAQRPQPVGRVHGQLGEGRHAHVTSHGSRARP